jgi:EpsI family protein
MGLLSWKRVCAAMLLLLVAGLVANFRTESKSDFHAVPISTSLLEFGPWKMESDIPLDGMIAQKLMLDDYLYRRFSDGQSTIVLYIGYYRNASKVGASHDPLVCFPGQGWVLKNHNVSHLTLLIQGKEEKISFATMVAERNGIQEYLLYWFQADANTAPNTFLQKLHLLKAKMQGKGQHNAFVRLSMNMKGSAIGDSRQVMMKFVTSFYPVFLNYVSPVLPERDN